MKKLICLTALLFLSTALRAQNATPPPPATHFILSGSASGFSGTGGGSSVASIAGAAIQLTPNFSAGYMQVTIPAISGRFQLGVINYTRTLHDLVGATIAKKFTFDLSSINVTFQGGGGKLLQPTANRIAETGGVYISYPLTNNISIQLLGISVLHGGIQTGFLTTSTTEAISTGLNFYF